MRNRVPVPASGRPPVPAFAPVPRKHRHDGWTPERQKAFIEALADCGSVRRAAAMVNMSNANAYALRRSPGAEGFRQAWEAALDFGVKRLKDLAFERAVEGELVPVFVAGKLMGFRRKHNDALLMFCLRHYGEDAGGRRTTVNYFSTRASAGVVQTESAPPPPALPAVPLPIASRQGGLGEGVGGAGASPPPSVVPLPLGGGLAEASATTVRTVITGPSTGSGSRDLEGAAAVLEGFAGVALDDEAHAAIAAALEACAARARAMGEATGEERADWEADDPDEHYVFAPHNGTPYRGALLPPGECEEFVPFVEGERHWVNAGAEMSDYEAEVMALGSLAAEPEPEPVGKRKR